MAENSLQKAFQLYKESCEKHEPLRGEKMDLFMEYVQRYIASCVRGRAFNESVFDDFFNECLLKVWDLAARMILPSDRVERFVEGLKVVTGNRCTDLLRSKNSYSNLTERFRDIVVPEFKPPMTPDSICCTKEIAQAPVALIARGMLARSRFPEIKEDHCLQVACIMFNEGPDSHIRKVIKGMQLFRFDFMLPYFQVLYKWAFFDLQNEVLVVLDRTRPSE